MSDTTASTVSMMEFDGRGGARTLNWQEADKGRSEAHFHWIQMNHLEEGAERILLEDLEADPLAARILLERETRPRTTTVGDHLIIILRGANLQEGALAEATVSLRVKVNVARAVTLSRHKFKTARDVEALLDAGHGPKDAGDFTVSIIRALLDNLAPVISRLSEDLDEVEDDVLDDDVPTEEGPLAGVRRRIISLRRYMAPQRDALLDLCKIKRPWLREEHLLLLREEAARMARMVADMDALRERGQMVQEEITFQLNKRINRNTFLLTLAAGVLLPLNLITGAFGMNVGGIPGEKWPWMFISLVGFFALFILSAAIVARLRRLF